MRRTIAGSAAALLLATSLSACGGADGSGGSLPTPTRTPTRELPTPTPSATDEPTEPTSAQPSDDTSEPEPTSAEPSDDTSEPEPTSAEPSDETTEPEPTRTPTRQPESTQPSDESDQEASELPSESAEASPDDDATADEAADDDSPSWLWWLLAALVLGAVVAIPLVVRSRRRAAWRRQLSQAEAELGWLARELLPELRRMGSVEQVAGAWRVAAPRVTAAEDALTVLEPTAPDDAGQERARALRDASRLARQRMEQLVAPGPHDTWALDLDAIMADLVAALGPPPAAPA